MFWLIKTAVSRFIRFAIMIYLFFIVTGINLLPILISGLERLIGILI